MKTVDVIIPTYRPTEKLKKLLQMLSKQTHPVHNIILINTEEKHFASFFYGSRFLEQFKNLTVRHISKYEFDHGGTRRLGVSLSGSDYFICMTDDAVPMDDKLVETLIAPLESGDAVVSYARQCTAKKCTDAERFTRLFNYPKESSIKSKKDLETLGIKTYFCSNVCAAYNREVYDELGGFVYQTIFNEDMLYAAKVINADYSIAYQAEAKVVHQHKYTDMQQLRRNFDLGVSQAKHPEVFAAVSSESEGKKLVKQTAEYLKEKGEGKQVPALYITSAYKYIGYWLGKHYKKIPKKIILKLTMNPCYWNHEDKENRLKDPGYGYGHSKVEDTWNTSVKVSNRKNAKDPYQ